MPLKPPRPSPLKQCAGRCPENPRECGNYRRSSPTTGKACLLREQRGIPSNRRLHLCTKTGSPAQRQSQHTNTSKTFNTENESGTRIKHKKCLFYATKQDRYHVLRRPRADDARLGALCSNLFHWKKTTRNWCASSSIHRETTTRKSGCELGI